MNLKIKPSEATKTPLYSITCTNTFGDFMAPVICDNEELAFIAFYDTVETILAEIANLEGEHDFVRKYGKDIDDKFYSEWLPQQPSVSVEATKIRFELEHDDDFFEINLYCPAETKIVYDTSTKEK